MGGRVGFIDRARENNKAHAAVGIHLEPGVIPNKACALLMPQKSKIESMIRKSKIENRKSKIDATELPSCARISARAAQRRRRQRRWRGEEGGRRPSPEGQVLRRRWRGEEGARRPAPKAKSCATSCGTSSATSCAASFTCSSFMGHLRAGVGGARVRVAARRNIPFFAP